MKIAIVGGGWTGCHLALQLKELGVQVQLFEAEERLFTGASGNNQCRLHLGFHYPRTYWTIQDMVDSYGRFRALYTPFAKTVKKNLYAVASSNSVLDFQTFQSIMRSHKIVFQEESPDNLGLSNVDGVVSCDEMAIDNAAAASFFQRELSSVLHLKSKFDFSSPKSREYDWVINCTYNMSAPFQLGDFRYEVCTLFSYTSEAFQGTALTVMDGPFASIYPLPGMQNGFTLSGVRETALSAHDTPEKARVALSNVTEKHLDRARRAMEEKISFFYGAFPKEFRYVSPILSVKTKPRNEADARRWHKVVCDGNIIHAFSSKINNIFPVQDEVFGLMGVSWRKAAA